MFIYTCDDATADAAAAAAAAAGGAAGGAFALLMTMMLAVVRDAKSPFAKIAAVARDAILTYLTLMAYFF